MEQLLRRWRQLGIWLPTAFVAAISALAGFISLVTTRGESTFLLERRAWNM